jgi:hypothetical protein
MSQNGNTCERPFREVGEPIPYTITPRKIPLTMTQKPNNVSEMNHPRLRGTARRAAASFGVGRAIPVPLGEMMELVGCKS